MSKKQGQRRISFREALRTHRTSVLALVLANALSLFLSVRAGLDVFAITFLFGIETFIVGVFGFIKALLREKAFPEEAESSNLGTYLLVYLPGYIFGFLFYEFYLFAPRCSACNGTDTEAVLRTLTNPAFVVAVGALFLSHLYSFFYNAYDREGFRSERRPTAAFAVRALLIWLYVMVAGSITEHWLPTTAVFTIILGKMVADVIGHIQERRSAGTPGTLPSGSIFPPTQKRSTNYRFAIGALLTVIALTPILMIGQQRRVIPTLTCRGLAFPQFSYKPGAQYCHGFSCANALTASDCAAMDVLAGNNVRRSGRDGVGDCRWNDVVQRCFAKAELAGEETPIPPADLALRGVPGLEGRTFMDAEGAPSLSKFEYISFPWVFGQESQIRWTTDVPTNALLSVRDSATKKVNENGTLYDTSFSLSHTMQLPAGSRPNLEFLTISCMKEVEYYPDPSCSSTDWFPFTVPSS